MKKLISLFLVFSILGLSGNLFAKERRGANIEIYKTKPKMEGTPWEAPDIRGELIAVKQNSLLLLDAESGADVTVDIGEVSKIRIVKKSKMFLRSGLGFLIGLGLGVLMGVAYDEKGDVTSVVDTTFAFGVVGSAIGLGVGVISGVSAGAGETFRFEHGSDAGIKAVLEKLRKKARVPDYQ